VVYFPSCIVRTMGSSPGDPDPRLRIYEPVEFIHSFLLDALEFTKIPETIAVHVTCSSIKLGLREKFLAVAGACAETVVVPDRVGCCGVAGDRCTARKSRAPG